MTTAVEPNDLTYEFDPYGNSAANRINNEYHIITADNSRKYNILVPLKAPFFANGFKLFASKEGGAYVELSYGVDYNFGHEFMSASRKCGKPIYGSVVFTDERFSGNLKIERYNTLGGSWVNDSATLSEIIATTVYNPRVTTWEKVLGLPHEFPTIDHEHNVEDLGMGEVVDAINRCGDILEAGAGTGGPGGLPSLEALGLDKVPNLPLAPDNIASAAQSKDYLVTPYAVRLAIKALILNDYQTFINRTDNPHNVTAEQVGAFTKTEIGQALSQYLKSDAVAVDSSKFSGKTLLEVAELILEGTAANSELLDGLNVNQLAAMILQGTAANSQRFDNKTYEELLVALAQDSTAGSEFMSQILVEASANLPGQAEYVRIAKTRSYQDGNLQDGYLILTGGNVAGSGVCPVWIVRTLNTLPEAQGRHGLEVIELTDTNLPVQFGLSILTDNPADPEVEVWMKGTSPIAEINISILTKDVFEYPGSEAFTLTAPNPVVWQNPTRGVWNSQKLGGKTPDNYALVTDIAEAFNHAIVRMKQ